jgi:hypothetical protein
MILTGFFAYYQPNELAAPELDSRVNDYGKDT